MSILVALLLSCSPSPEPGGEDTTTGGEDEGGEESSGEESSGEEGGDEGTGDEGGEEGSEEGGGDDTGGVAPPQGDCTEADGLWRCDHAVVGPSAVPGHEGESRQLWARELVGVDHHSTGVGAGELVVLVHAYGIGAEGLFDIPGASLAEDLAQAGLDTWIFDLSGYGRSEAPAEQDDPCNLSAPDRATYGYDCEAPYPFTLTTTGSELADLVAVLDHIEAVRGHSQVHLLGLSLGGQRVVSLASQAPDRVGRVVSHGTAGNGGSGSDTEPATVPSPGSAMIVRTREAQEELIRRGDCREGQLDEAVVDAALDISFANDAVGASWGPGLLRTPTRQGWFDGVEAHAALVAPTLVVGGSCDLMAPEGAVDSFAGALGATSLVRAHLEGAGHFVPVEQGRSVFAGLVAEWLLQASLDGREAGTVRVGIDGSRTWD